MTSTAQPQWDNQTKTVDRERPFHRINFKDFDASGSKTKADGEGTKCGCVTKQDFGDFIKDLISALLTDSDLIQSVLKELLGDEGFGKLMNAIQNLGLGGFIVSFLVSWAKETIEGIAKKIYPKAVRATPQWAPVKQGSRNDIADASQVVELEGFVTRSYHNAIDVPLFQWHHWYNWSLHIHPEKGYEWVAATTHNPPSTKDFEDEDDDDDNNKDDDERVITQDGSVECQWDVGALLANQTLFDEGMPDSVRQTFPQRAELTGPMFLADWAWPMTGQYAWTAGRWVYECGKSTELDEEDKKKKPKYCSMLNPCRAVATARWEAFQFPENGGPRVPAIQFMFFACKRGGYIDHEAIDDTDYEFIVDLPDLGEEDLAPFPIGHTDDFPLNTIVLRPRLLKHFDRDPFRVAGGDAGPNPVVEPLRPEKGTVPKQAKVTISREILKGLDAYGVIISLGWHDPVNVQAGKVRRCLVQLERVDDRALRINPLDEIAPILDALNDGLVDAIADALIDSNPITKNLPDSAKNALKKFVIKPGLTPVKLLFKGILEIVKASIRIVADVGEPWLFQVGVNGRWVYLFRNNEDKKNVDLVIGKSFDIFLGEKDRLYISFNGCRLDRIGQFFFRKKLDRQLKLGSRVVSWKEIVEADKATRKKLLVEFVGKLMTTFGLENQLLGFIDPRIDPGLKITDYNYGRDAEPHNPLWFDDKPHPFGQNASKVGLTDGTTQELKLTGDFARAVGGPQCVYVEKPGEKDYVLVYALSLDKQPLP